VIEVRVTDEREVAGRHLRRGERGRRHALLDVDRTSEIRIGQDVAVAETEEDGGVPDPDHRQARAGIVEGKAVDGRLEPVRRAAEREEKERGDLLDARHGRAKINRRLDDRAASSAALAAFRHRAHAAAGGLSLPRHAAALSLALLCSACFGIGRKPIGEVYLAPEALDGGPDFANALYQTTAVRLESGNSVEFINNGEV